MTNKYTATLPDGTIATRNSRDRIYTHAVAIGPLDPARYATETTAGIAATREKIATITAALINPTVTLNSRGITSTNDATNFYSHEAFLTGAFTRVRGEGRRPSYLIGEPELRCNYAAEYADDFSRYSDMATWTGKTLTDPSGKTKAVMPVLDALIIDARAAIATHTEFITELQARLVTIKNGTADLGSWRAVAWSGRPDLAEKEAARYRAHRPAYTVILVDAILK